MAARMWNGPNTIYLRAGTFYLPSTLQLNSEDNGLTIANYPGKSSSCPQLADNQLSLYTGETVYVSGGVPLKGLNWKPYNVSSTRQVAVYQNQNNVYGQVSPKGNTINIRCVCLCIFML